MRVIEAGRFWILVVMTLVLGACASPRPTEIRLGPETRGNDRADSKRTADLNPETNTRGLVVYFESEGVDILQSSQANVQMQGEYLLAHPEKRAVLEGHTDERGSAEYNMALGERRAQVVARMLRQLGVSQNQMRLVSFGEEKPVASGHDESVWQKNRRVEFNYQK